MGSVGTAYSPGPSDEEREFILKTWNVEGKWVDIGFANHDGTRPRELKDHMWVRVVYYRGHFNDRPVRVSEIDWTDRDIEGYQVCKRYDEPVEVPGQPLSNLGLQCAVVVHADGRREPLKGFAVPQGVTIQDALTQSLPEGASLIIEHDWIPHYRPDGTTSYVCSRCASPRFEPDPTQEPPKTVTPRRHRFAGRSVIYGREGDHDTPYMTRYWIGRLRLHIFWRGDQDPDCHDHPWDFWTFPLTPYAEEVAEPYAVADYADEHDPAELGVTPRKWKKRLQIVPAWRWTFRPATHCHRVIGRLDHVQTSPPILHLNSKPIVTLVWRGRPSRKWGFLKNRDGKWCWVAWKEYVFGGGKSAPCE